jgi:hypothetical protein
MPADGQRLLVVFYCFFILTLKHEHQTNIVVATGRLNVQRTNGIQPSKKRQSMSAVLDTFGRWEIVII